MGCRGGVAVAGDLWPAGKCGGGWVVRMLPGEKGHVGVASGVGCASCGCLGYVRFGSNLLWGVARDRRACRSVGTSCPRPGGETPSWGSALDKGSWLGCVDAKFELK